MKELNQFQCEFCNTIYKNKGECEACENFHLKSKRIVREVFAAKINGLKYPQKVHIEMEDGKIACYKYEGRIK